MPSYTFEASEPGTPITPRTPRSFQQFVSRMNILNNGHRSSASQSKRGSGTRRSFPALFPILPNPFEHIHPALRSPSSTRSVIDPAVASPAPTRTNFSPMGSNPFVPRSSFFSRRIPAATVLDYGGNVPIDMPGSEMSDDEERGLSASVVDSQSQWPSAAGQRRRRRRTRKRSSQKTNAPIWFPAMKSRRVRIKMLHSFISGTILLLLIIIYFVLQGANANINAFQIIFILMFILLAIALTHSLVSLWLLIRRWKLRQLRKGQTEDYYCPPNQAIPVILARDEEIGIGGSVIDEELEKESAASVAPPPPAYGRWRGSVRVDPTLLHWQRREMHDQPPTPEIHDDTIPRPPSYTPPMQHPSRMEGGFF